MDWCGLVAVGVRRGAEIWPDCVCFFCVVGVLSCVVTSGEMSGSTLSWCYVV